MKKRFTNLWISIVLAVCQLICLPAISINAETRLSESRHYRAMPYGRTLTDNESVSVVHSEKDTLHGEFYYRTDGDRACITRYLGGGTNVVIPDQLDGYEVGEIGDRAFESCEDIVSVEIPLTVTKIGKHAFGKCGRLESIVIPDSVTEIGSRAFISCESLKDVKLSKNISKIEESVFWECGSLTEVKIPEGVKEICFGAFYFTKIKNVYIPDSVTKVADYAFGLTVEYVSLPEDTKYIKNYSFVNYNGWNQEKIEMELRPAPVRVPEHTEDGEADELALTSAKYVYGEKVVDVLYIAHVIEASHKPFDLYCEVKDKNLAEKYELYTGKVKIAESTDGNFIDVQFDKFETGERVTVCVIGKEKTVTTTLLLDIRKDQAPGSWKLKLGGDGLAFTLDQRVPYFGGGEVKVNFPSVPVNMVVEDGKVKVGFNIPEEKLPSWDSNSEDSGSGDKKKKKKSMKEKIEDWKKDIKKTGKINEDYKKYIQSDDLTADLPFMKEKVKVTVFGYAEGEFSDAVERISGQIVVAVSGSATFQSTILVMEVIPVTAYCKISAKAELEGTAQVDLTDFALSGNLDYNSNIGVEPFAGFGAGTWLSCGVYGKLDLGLEATLLSTTRSTGPDRLYLTGEFGVKAFFAKKEVYKLPILSSKQWKNGFLGDYVNDKGQLLFYSRTENSLFHQQTGKLSKKNNLHGNDTALFEWNEDSRSVYQPVPYEDKNTQNVPFVSNAYGAAEPQIISTGDLSMIVYLDNDDSRALPNQTVLKYVVCDSATGTMSAPKIVLDDQTADFKPYVYTDGQSIYVCYLNSVKKYSDTEDPDISDYAGTFSITVARYDANADAFAESETFSRTNGYCYAPVLADTKDGLLLAWAENEDNQVFGLTNHNSVNYSVYKDGSWSAPKVLADNLNSITSLTAGSLSEITQIAYCEDTDNDLSTSEQNIYMDDLAGNHKKVMCDSVSNLQIMELPGLESSVLAYNKNGSVSYISGPDSADQKLFPEGIMDTGSNFQAEGNKIYFLKASKGGGRNIGCMIDTNGAWGSVDLTSEEDYIDCFSVSGGKCVYLVTSANMDGDEIDTISEIKFSQSVSRNNLTLNDVSFEEENLKPDSDISMLCTITNGGTDVVSHPVITLYDKNNQGILQQQTLDLSIDPGATVQREIIFKMPSDFENAVYEIGIEENGMADSDPADNYVSADLSKTELAISTEYRVRKEGHYVAVHVDNTSNVTATADIVVTKPDGSILLSEDNQIIPANDRAEFMVAVDEIIPDNDADIILTASVNTDAEEYYQSNNQCEQRIWNLDWTEPVIAVKEQKIQNIVLSLTDVSLTTDHTLQLQTQIVPENATNKNLKWSSDNEQVATVDPNGLVTAVGTGRATITVESQDGSNVKASCMITVTKTSMENPGNNDSSGDHGGGTPGGSTGGSSSSGSSPGSSSDKDPANNNSGGGNQHLQVNLSYYITNFDANGGTNLSRNKMTLLMDDTLGILPKVMRKNYTFQGWYTQKTGGRKVDSSTVLNASATLYAQWSEIAKPEKIKKLTLMSAKNRQLKVSFQKVTGAAGYQIVYSADKKFASADTRKVNIVSEKQTFYKLKKGKKYYVKVRAYKTGSMNEKIYGSYCKVKSIIIK